MKIIAVVITLWLTASQTSAQTAQPWPQLCTHESTKDCGAIYNFTISDFPGLSIPAYVFSDREKAGTCRRQNIDFKGKPTASVDNSTLAKCMCVNTNCQTCTRNKKPADVASCCGSSQAVFVYNNVVYKFQDPGAPPKKPTCCTAVGTADPVTGSASSVCYCEATTEGCFNTTTAAPTTTTAAPTTTTTTTAAPITTTAPPPLCPPTRAITSRIIGGTKTEACGSGIVRIANGNRVVCNAVYTYNPKGKDSTGAPLTKPLIYLPVDCTKSIDILLSSPLTGATLQIKVGDKTPFPYKADEVTRTPLANKFFVGLTLNKYNGGCLDAACAYNPDTMATAINKSNCYVLSFGADSINPVSSLPVTSGNLNKLEVYYAGKNCRDASGPKAECFLPYNLAGYTCSGDYGAPVYCYLNTGETVLYGSFALTPFCGPSNKVFPVVPINS